MSHSQPYLNLGLNIFDAITGFDLEGDGLTRQGFHENLHFTYLRIEQREKELIKLSKMKNGNMR